MNKHSSQPADVFPSVSVCAFFCACFDGFADTYQETLRWKKGLIQCGRTHGRAYSLLGRCRTMPHIGIRDVCRARSSTETGRHKLRCAGRKRTDGNRVDGDTETWLCCCAGHFPFASEQPAFHRLNMLSHKVMRAGTITCRDLTVSSQSLCLQASAPEWGSAADIVLAAMLRVWHDCRGGTTRTSDSASCCR